MRWFEQSELEFYHSNPVFGCYKDAVFAPHDIIMQMPRLSLSTAYSLQIFVCDKAGVFIEDATAYFDSFLASYIIAGVTYYYVNIRLDRWSPAMLANGCFTLNGIISDPTTGTTVFNQFTQIYSILGPTETFVPVVLVDGSPIVECIPGSQPSNCNRSYVKLSCYFDCIDTYSGEYYGSGTTIAGSGTYPFLFTRATYIEGKFRKLPNEIKRTVSINCRTQKTEWTPKYSLLGTAQGAFPQWKADDIETMMLGSSLYVDDTEYQSEGGTIFERFGTQAYNCQVRYKLVIPFQKCYDYQIFGCVSSCADLESYYMFPRSFERLYNERKQLIAEDMDGLKMYMESLAGNKMAQNLPFALPCPVFGLMKVQSSGSLPPYVYIDEPIPVNRVYRKQLPANTLNLSSLCNGVTNTNQVPVPEVGTIVSEAIIVPVPQVGTIVSQDANQYTLSFTTSDDFVTEFATTSAVNYAGEVNLNISIKTDTLTPPFVNVTIGQISQDGWPAQSVTIYGDDNPNMLPGSTLTINQNGNVIYTGDATSADGFGIYFLEIYNITYNVN